MTDIVEYGKDGIILLLGGSAALKVLAVILDKLKGNNKNKSEQRQNVTVNASTNKNGNGRVFATKAELSTHALECAGKIHERINQNYEKLSTQMNENHKESMRTIGKMQISIAHLEAMKSPRSRE